MAHPKHTVLAISFLSTGLFLSGSLQAAPNEEQDLGEVLVTAEEARNPVAPVTDSLAQQKNVLTREQIENQAATDINHALAMIPGVLTRSDTMIGGQTGHGIYVRGRGANHPSPEVAITFDGAPRMGALYGQSLFDGVSLGSVESIEVRKSPQPSQFGSGYASVDMKARKMTREGTAASLALAGGSHETFTEEATAGYKKGDFDIYASQNWSSTDGHVSHSRAQQQSYYVNGAWQINENYELRLLANKTKAQTLQPNTEGGASSEERYDTDTSFFTATLNNRFDTADGFVKIYYNDTDYTLRNEVSSSGALTTSVQSAKLYGLRAKENWHLENTTLSLGFDLDRTELSNKSRVNATGATNYWDFPDITLFSPYMSASHDFALGSWTLTPSAGLRYYQHSEFKDVLAPQVGFVASTGIFRWNVNYARGVNYPSAVALQGYVRRGSSQSGLWGDLKPEVVDHYETGVGLQFNETDSVNLTVFHDKGKDRFRVYMYGAAKPVWNDPIGRYKVTGVEASAQATFADCVDAFAAVTYMKVRAKDQSGTTTSHMPYSPKWTVQAGATWRMTDKWKFYADAQYVADLWSGTNARPQGFSYASGSKKLKDFLLVNAKISRKFEAPQGLPKKGEVYVAVNNILNRDYAWDAGYPMPGITAFLGVKFEL